MANKAKLLQLAQKHLSKGNLEKAIKVFQQLVDLEPGNQRIALRLADLLAKTGKIATAVEQYERVAEIHVREDFIPKAIAVYRTVVRIDPERLSAYERLAELYKGQGLEAEALAQLQNIFELYQKKNDVTRQVEVLRVMVDMDPENLGFQVRLGEILAKSGDEKAAARAFASAATTLSRRGFHDRASELFEKIVALDPNNIGIREELCSHYLENGQYQEAKKEIESILEIGPDDPRMILLLGRINFQLGEDREAEECISRSLALFKETDQLEQVVGEFLFVAQTHLKNGELNQAEVFFRQIIKVDPEQSRAFRGLADVLGSSGDQHAQIQALLDLGRSLEKNNDTRGAAESYSKILEIDPGMDEARTSLENLGDISEDENLQDIIQPVDLEDEALSEIFPDDGSGLDDEPMSMDTEEGLDGEPEPEIELEPEAEVIVEQEAVADTDNEALLEELGDEPEEELPDVIMEDVEPEPTPVFESSLIESAPPDTESADIVPEDSLIEADVYLRYGLHDKALEILDDLQTKYPDRIDVLEKALEAQIEVAPERVVTTGLSLVTALLDRGEAQRAGSIYQKIAETLPDLGGLEEIARLIPDVSQETTLEVSWDESPEMPLDSSSKTGTTVPPAPGEDPFADDMEEADFYISQGLTEDAERVYRSILEKSPDHQGAIHALSNLQGQGAGMEEPPLSPVEPLEPDEEPAASEIPQGAPAPEVSPDITPPAGEFKGRLTVEDSVPDAGGFLDLAEELRSELGEELEKSSPPVVEQGSPITFEEIFAEFKKGIAETLGAEEYETHYNLGIAYKDMGLFDDAIVEFETATGDKKLLQDSMSLIAMCFVEKQDYDSAAKTIDKALESSGDESVPGLTFQMAQIRERQQRWKPALEAYKQVQSLDPEFDGINNEIARVEELCRGDMEGKMDAEAHPEGGLDDLLSDLIKEVEDMAQEETGGGDESPDGDGEPGARSKKDRVSYL